MEQHFQYGVACALEEVPASWPINLRGSIDYLTQTASQLGYDALELQLCNPQNYDWKQLRQTAAKGLGDQQRRPYHRDIEEQGKYQIRCLGCLFQPHHLLRKKYKAGRAFHSAGLADETVFLLCPVRSYFLTGLFFGRGRLLPGIQLRLIAFQPFQNRRPLIRHRPGSRFPAAG